MGCGGGAVRRLILASASPRRRQILTLLGLPFVIKVQGVDETPLAGEAPPEMVLRVAQAKALALPTHNSVAKAGAPQGGGMPGLAQDRPTGNGVRPDELVIAADTTVVSDGAVLGKPADARQAADMLGHLRDRAHLVYTGLAVWHPEGRCMVTELSQSVVWMRNYSDNEIEAYVATGDPLDKAGAYAIQHPGFDPVARVDGCWLNVMGLPLCHLRRALGRFGMEVPSDVPGTCQAFNQMACEAFATILKAGGRD